MQGLHARLAAAGVPLFDVPETGTADLTANGLENLIVDLLAEDSATLYVSIPSLLAAQHRIAHGAVLASVRRLDLLGRSRLGLLYRLARSLVISRRPDLDYLYGPRPPLAPWSGEPGNLPDPDEDFGETCLWRAKESDEEAQRPGVAGDVERSFDRWIRILLVERGRS